MSQWSFFYERIDQRRLTTIDDQRSSSLVGRITLTDRLVSSVTVEISCEEYSLEATSGLSSTSGSIRGAADDDQRSEEELFIGLNGAELDCGSHGRPPSWILDRGHRIGVRVRSSLELLLDCTEPPEDH